MSSLSKCLKSAGKLVSQDDIADIRAYQKDALADGLSQQEAAISAVEQIIADVEAERQGIIDQVVEQGGQYPEVEYNQSGLVTDTPAFKKWSGTDTVINSDEINDTDFSGKGPFVMRAHHGTTHEISEFNASVKGVTESQFGAVNYFTSDYSDAQDNYAGEGPDLTNRIEQLAERIEQEENIEMDEARSIAREKLHGGNEQVLEVYIRTEKPFVVGDENSPWMEFVDYEELEGRAIDRVSEGEGVEVKEIEENRDDYEDQIDKARWEIEADEPNALIEAIQTVAARYDADAGGILESVSDYSHEGINQSKLEELLRGSEALGYAEDMDTGDLVGYQMLGEIIQELGFDSIILKNANERFENMNMGYGTAHVHVFDENNTNIKSVENTGAFNAADSNIFKQENLGSIKFTDDSAVISLFENANLSTFLHESAHFFLEATRRFAAQPNAPEAITKDMDALNAWFKETSPEWDGVIGTEQHEQFARGFETFLWEGKSPNLEMQGIFSQFRDWLINVYKSLKPYVGTPQEVQLTAEVRQVMDRMLATDESIKEAQLAASYGPMYESQKEAGMTAAEWRNYQDQGRHQKQQGADELQKRSMADMKWESNAMHRVLPKVKKEVEAKRKPIRAEVAAEVGAEAVYRAMRFLRYGEIIDETGNTVRTADVHKIDPEVLETLFPEDGEYFGGKVPNWQQLGTGKNGMLEKGGMGYGDINMLAQHFALYGDKKSFTSAEDMILSILEAEPYKVKVDRLTNERMLEKYGDITSQKAMDQAALEAIHNEAHLKFLNTELKFLSKAVGKAGILAKAAKGWAEQIISRKKVKDAIKTAPYLAAEKRAGKASERSHRKGDRAAAEAHKRAQVLSVHFYRAAAKAGKDVEKGLRYLKKFDRPGIRKVLDAEYLDRIYSLLEQYDLRKSVSLKAIENRKSMLEWIADQNAQGLDPIIDQYLIDNAKKQHYKDMPLEEFRGLVESIKSIEHVARRKYNVDKARNKREFDATMAKASASLEENHNRIVPARPTRSDVAGKTSKLNRIFAIAHRKLASLLREQDGGKDGGWMIRLLGYPAIEAQTMETEGKYEASKVISEAFKNIKVRTWPGNIYAYKYQIPGTNIQLTDEQRIMVAYYWGEGGNRQRLKDGGILESRVMSDQELEAILDTITKKEWDAVQAIWDYYGTLRADAFALEKRLTGREPKALDPAPIQTKYGVYRGGYAPAKYDADLSIRSDMLAAKNDMRQATQGVFNKANTRDSYAQKRATEVKGMPLLLSFSVIPAHINEVIHRVAWQEYINNADRILKALEPDIRKYYGTEVFKEMQLTIADVASGDQQKTHPYDPFLNHVRVGTTIVGMGWRFSTAAIQSSGIANSIERVGAEWVGVGLKEYMKNPLEAGRFVDEHSKLMRNRTRTFMREVNEVMNKIRIGNKVPAVEASYFYVIGKMQRTVDVPTWLGAYHKGLDQLNYGLAESEGQRNAIEHDAGLMADQAVKDSQSHGDIIDMARVQRGSPAHKLFTNFYSFFSATFNLNAEAFRRTHFKDFVNNPANMMRFIGSMITINMIPVIYETLLREALKPECGTDLECLGKKLASNQLDFMFGQMILLRELGAGVSWWDQRYGYSGPAGMRFFKDFYDLSTQAGQLEIDMALFKALNKVGGTLLHYPAGQVNSTIEGAFAISEGKVEGIGKVQALLAGPPRK
jgi:hypothetical protein